MERKKVTVSGFVRLDFWMLVWNETEELRIETEKSWNT